MDKQAFKQRMQNLKSYRENNPGKGYWDWKVEAFQGGGEIGNEERQYLHSWYTNRREYAKRHMPAMLKQLDDANIYIDPNSRIRNIYSTPITISNDKIKQASKDSGIGEYGGYYHPNEGVVLPSDYKQWKDREPLLHELNHVVNIFNSSISDQVNKVLKGKQIIDRGQEVNNYLTTPSEVQSRLIEFRKLNNLDPTKVYGIPDVREWRRTGKDADLLNTFDDDTVLELINTVAHTPNKKVQRAAEGGQIGDPEKERFYQATGRSSSGIPLGEYTPELPHAGSYNSVLYYNASNDKLYQRAYDLNDYGPTDTKDKGASSMYIGPIRWLSRQLDKAGTPFVQRTGFVPLDEGKYYNQLPESAKKKVRERRRLRNSYEYGGEVNEFQRKTRRDIMQESLVDGRPDYNKMFQNQNEYQKDFANYWYTERAKNPKYSDQIGGDKLGSVLSNIDKATWKTPTEAMRDNMVGQGYNPTDAQINQQLNILKEKGTKGFANPKAHSYTSLRPANTWHEGIGHMVGDNTPAILNATPNVRISNSDSSYEDYVNQANEKHAQTWDFRGNNSNLKDDQGNYYIDPNRQLTPEDINNMRSKGAKIPEQWESLKDADISELTNTFAYNMYQDPVQYMANGGEVGDPDDEFIQAVNTKLGRTPDGRPKEQGLKPVIDLEDAVNVTPIGDVLSAKDAYNAARSNDWLGVGLATATMIPFVPRAISTVRRSTPTVKNYRSSLSNALDKAVKLGEKERRMSARLNNETYETVQRLMDDPSYMRRAQQVKEKYGDDYTQIYADLIDAYNNSPELLPKAKRTAFEDNARARMATTTESTKRHMDGGEFPKMGEYEYQYDINGVPYGTTIHEMNHNADYLKNKAADADANSNLYYWMRSALKPFSRIDPNTDKLTKYYSKPTEQKAYMNQLREFMYANKMIDTRDQIVTPDLIKQAISKLPKGMQSIKKASEQFKSMRSYTKWFNTIPLLGVGAVGANKYFTSNENRD